MPQPTPELLGYLHNMSLLRFAAPKAWLMQRPCFVAASTWALTYSMGFYVSGNAQHKVESVVGVDFRQ